MKRIEIKATAYIDDDLITAYDDDGSGFDADQLSIRYGYEDVQDVALDVARLDHVEAAPPYDAAAIEARFQGDAVTAFAKYTIEVTFGNPPPDDETIELATKLLDERMDAAVEAFRNAIQERMPTWQPNVEVLS